MAVVDLGAWWKEETGDPLPLGGNGIRRDLDPAHSRRLCRLLTESIAYGLDHRDEALDYAMRYARGLEDDPARSDRFVGMYVNEWTRDYGARGAARGAAPARPRPRRRHPAAARGRGVRRVGLSVSLRRAPARSRAVVFDLDGTLVDSRPDIATAVNRMRADLGAAAARSEAVGAMMGEGARHPRAAGARRRPARSADRPAEFERSRSFPRALRRRLHGRDPALRRHRGAAREMHAPLAARAAHQQADRDDAGAPRRTSAGRRASAPSSAATACRTASRIRPRRCSRWRPVWASRRPLSSGGRQPDRRRDGERRRSGLRLGGVGLCGGRRPPRAGERSRPPAPPRRSLAWFESLPQ